MTHLVARFDVLWRLASTIGGCVAIGFGGVGSQIDGPVDSAAPLIDTNRSLR